MRGKKFLLRVLGKISSSKSSKSGGACIQSNCQKQGDVVEMREAETQWTLVQGRERCGLRRSRCELAFLSCEANPMLLLLDIDDCSVSFFAIAVW